MVCSVHLASSYCGQMVGQTVLVAHLFPQFLGHVRSEGIQQLQQHFILAAGGAAGIRQGVHIDHQLGDGGVGLQAVDVLAHLLDGAVHQGFQFGTHAAFQQLVAHGPDAVQEALATLDGGGVPGSGLLEVADEHLIQAQGIGTVLVHHSSGLTTLPGSWTS